MDKPVGMQIPSAQFRKTYPRLTVPTLVTVNGHVIGTWIPGTDATVASYEAGRAWMQDRGPIPSVRVRVTGPEPLIEFRPAPKPGKGK